MNWYNYVGGDPVNWRDPLGMQKENEKEQDDATSGPDIVVTGRHGGSGGSAGGGGSSMRAAVIQRSEPVPPPPLQEVTETPQDGEDTGEDIIVTARLVAIAAAQKYSPIDPRRYRGGDYPRVEGCIRFSHECLAQPTTITPNARNQCLGAELLCQAESFLRSRAANDERTFDYCHNYSCFIVDRNGRVVFYDKRFGQ